MSSISQTGNMTSSRSRSAQKKHAPAFLFDFDGTLIDRPNLTILGVGPDVPVVTRDQVARAKPDPDVFLAAAEQLRVPMSSSVVVGDSVWDLLAARRAGALGVGLLSGGYGREELESAGAYRVYNEPADLLRHLDEVGGR
jgi:phosphoglycolate phosphatase-like HAD superfamily hydrolase